MAHNTGEPCRFCEIVQGTRPTAIVFEDQTFLAFLDVRPLFPGHTLLVPKTHLAALADVPADLLGPLLARVQLLARAVEEAMDAEGSFVAINNRVSQSVPHLHVHVVPRRKGDGLRGFFWPRTKYRDELEMAETADRIRRAVGPIGA